MMSYRVATVLEIREKLSNLRKEDESHGKFKEFWQVVLTLKFTTPQIQLDDLSFYENAMSRSHGKFSEVTENPGKMKVEKSGHPVVKRQNCLKRDTTRVAWLYFNEADTRAAMLPCLGQSAENTIKCVIDTGYAYIWLWFSFQTFQYQLPWK